jgi:hypothetical protein
MNSPWCKTPRRHDWFTSVSSAPAAGNALLKMRRQCRRIGPRSAILYPKSINSIHADVESVAKEGRSDGREPHAVGFRRSGAARSDSGLTGSAIHQRGRDDPCAHVCGSVSIRGEVPLPSPGTAGCNAACGLSYWCFATLPLSSETKDCPAGVAFTAVPETISFALTSLP